MTEHMSRAKPTILLIGEIVLAHSEWHSLSEVAYLRILSQGTRDQFLKDLDNGAYDDVHAVSRTFDSTQITGRFDGELVNLLPSGLKFVCHNGAGYDSVDAQACAARGISVSNTPGAVDASTASTAIFLLLGALRRSHIPSTALRAGKWRGKMQLTHDPENKILGILGMGGIGTAFAKRAVGFGMKIQYHNRHQLPAEKNPVGAAYVSFHELLETSDIISVHLPLNDGTRQMIGRKQFDMMKDGVVFVNTARGLIVDEAALVEALESGKVFGAGLDVFEREPQVHEGLIRNENCVLMPHVGTATIDTQYKMEMLVIENLKSVISTGSLKTPVAETRNMLGEVEKAAQKPARRSKRDFAAFLRESGVFPPSIVPIEVRNGFSHTTFENNAPEEPDHGPQTSAQSVVASGHAADQLETNGTHGEFTDVYIKGNGKKRGSMEYHSFSGVEGESDQAPKALRAA